MSSDFMISVVMSVRNDASTIEATLDSVLSQLHVNLEFIVIDDGSTDETGAILKERAARDRRLRVIHQENTGLTRALIRGCGMARGKYIARQDGGGDLSLPDRLFKQTQFLESDPNIVLTSCGTRVIGPEGEVLYQIVQEGTELQKGLEQLVLGRATGPSHHGSTMFPKWAYDAVEGYRRHFFVGQDSDLWLRLAEIGLCSAIPEVLYEARLLPESISAMNREEQLEAGRLMLECAKLRRSGLDDGALLKRRERLRESKTHDVLSIPSVQKARFYYFVASNLRGKAPDRARYYYWKSLRCFPFYPRSIIRLLKP